MGSVTQKDIAARAGVSVSLVSRALAGRAEAIGISPATVAKVRQAARELGYTPNASARMLKGAASRTVGVVVYDFEDPFFGPVIRELQRCSHARHYSLVLGGFEQRQVWDLDVTALLKHQIDGLIIIGSGHDVEWTAPFAAKGVRLVRIGHGPARPGLQSFEADDVNGMTALAAGLQAKGYHRLGFVGADQPMHRMRYAHFRRAWRAMGGDSRGSLQPYFSTARLWEAGRDAGQHLASTPPSRPDAIVAASDVVALGVLRALAERGLAVPADCAVTGYDDIPAAALTVPALTTVRQPVIALARAAFDWIIAPTGPRPGRTVLAPAPVWRESA